MAAKDSRHRPLQELHNLSSDPRAEDLYIEARTASALMRLKADRGRERHV